MALPTIIIGILLIVVGCYGYFTGHPDAAGVVSKTALIPAWVGLTLVILGAAAFCEKCRKHVMHLAAMVGLLAAVGDGFQLIKTINNSTAAADVRQLKIISMSATLVLCVIFVALCVRSFIQARKNRQAGMGR